MTAPLLETARAVVVFTFVLTTLVFVPRAVADFPGQNGKLAVHYAGEIWVAGADGSNRTQLSRPGFDRSPSWSRDGTKITFSSDNKIVMMNADGSDQRQLTFGAPRDRTTAWTADGRQVVYDREFVEIYVVNADGSGGERKVTDGLMPATSPYGHKIAFSAAGGGLFTINPDGSNRRQITEAGRVDFGAHWSPGGTDLVFTRTSESDRDVYRVHANGVGVVRLTNTVFAGHPLTRPNTSDPERTTSVTHCDHGVTHRAPVAELHLAGPRRERPSKKYGITRLR